LLKNTGQSSDPSGMRSVHAGPPATYNGKLPTRRGSGDGTGRMGGDAADPILGRRWRPS